MNDGNKSLISNSNSLKPQKGVFFYICFAK